MTLILILTIIQITCYQLCAVPGIYRIWKRRSSEDLSIWREILILTGATFQLMVFYLVGVAPVIFVSPVTSMLSVGTMLGTILYWRGKHGPQ